MSGDYGPLQTYQIIWRSGHVEEIKAHQVLLPPLSLGLFGSSPSPRENKLTVHGEVDGRWKLLLDVDYSDVSSVRLLPSDVEAVAE